MEVGGSAGALGKDNGATGSGQRFGGGEESFGLGDKGTAGNFLDEEAARTEIGSIGEGGAFVIGDDADFFVRKASGEGGDAGGFAGTKKAIHNNVLWLFGVILQLHTRANGSSRGQQVSSGDGEIHFSGEIKDTTALRAGDEFLLSLAGKDDLHG